MVDGTWMRNLTTSAHAHTNTAINQNDDRGKIKHMAIKNRKKCREVHSNCKKTKRK